MLIGDKTFDTVRNCVKAEFSAVNDLILDNLHSDVPLIQQITQHIIHSGGKRLRPLLTLLSAKLFNYTGRGHITLAAIIEFIHTATLLHDDVVDNSCLRRNQKTANAIWGNQASILVGDFLYSRTFQMMNSLESLAIMQLMANTTNAIAEGEVLQLMNRHNPQTTESRYLEVIRAKTAILFATACQLGTIIADQPHNQQQTIANYGLHLGMAFQLVDDLLDYTASAETMGKNMGDDLAEGKPTLPLIYAMKQASPSEAKIIENAIVQGQLTDMPAILQIIEKTKAFDYVKQMAIQHADLAKVHLLMLPDNIYRQALYDLIDLSVHRQS